MVETKKMWYRVIVEEYTDYGLATRVNTSSIRCSKIKDLGIIYKILKSVFR